MAHLTKALTQFISVYLHSLYLHFIIVWRCSVHLYYCDVERDCLRQMVMSLLKTWRHSMTVLTMSLWAEDPAPCSCLSSFPPKKTLCLSSVVVSPKCFHLISQSPRILHVYLSISCVGSWSFCPALSVLWFHVPMVMLSLPRIFDDVPVAYLTPPSWCTAEGAVLVDPGGDRSGTVWLLVFITWWVTGKV